jgi:N-acyl-D-amino-acid deacylase
MPDKQYQNPGSVEKAIADNGGPESITITEFKPNPAYAGQTLGELARTYHATPVEMYMRIVHEGDAADTEASVIGHSMVEDDVKAFYQQPWVMVASDGGIGSEHPRGAGTFPRVLGLYVRENKWITLPEAIRKMTSLPARRLGWKDRGTLRIGNFADLVLFNPDTVIDRSTFEKPFEPPAGIEKVFVNGQLTWDSGKPTGAKSGAVLTVAGRPVGYAK